MTLSNCYSWPSTQSLISECLIVYHVSFFCSKFVSYKEKRPRLKSGILTLISLAHQSNTVPYQKVPVCFHNYWLKMKPLPND
jgi:hypothetical protein